MRRGWGDRELDVPVDTGLGEDLVSYLIEHDFDVAHLRRGGKLILYHGWADDSVSPLGTIAYYAALERQMGGLEATQQFARLLAPAMPPRG